MPDTGSRSLPKHVAIVMDGNGRWARKRRRPRAYGHRAGAIRARDFVQLFEGYGIPYLTLFAFSTENWSRPRAEVDALIGLLSENLDEAIEIARSRNIRIRHLGQMEGLSAEIQTKAKQAIKLTENNTGLTVSLALNYGGRGEIIEAVQRIIQSGVAPGKVTEQLLSKYLYTSGIPDPDLIIRTGGEMRLSNFLIWQAAYAELYFTPVLWPDFDKVEFEKALVSYGRRQRRFGGLQSL